VTVAGQESISQIARLLRERNAIDEAIAAIIKRPMSSGHLGEWIAAEIFDIELERSASAAGIDGRFRGGPLQGSTVNVKWYLKQEGALDMNDSGALDYYLVLAGPRSGLLTSRNSIRPWRIDSVFLFDAQKLAAEQQARGVKTGIASSVRSSQWEAAEIFPAQRNPALLLSPQQATLLKLFAF
jgi:hypothetical protein